jgi:tRNA-uridine 2-sulfurtransferase
MESKKIVVGMSGGIDSSMAILLLKKQGWKPIGVSLKLAHWKNKDNILGENACCTLESLNVAKDVCKKLDIPYYIYDVSKDFKKEVMDYFDSELKNYKTPNPCVVCNRNLKFKKLFEWAHKHDIKYVASGHYANVKFNSKTKKYELIRSKDSLKDQTYTLSLLKQEWLKYLVFPLAKYTKKQIYALAKKNNFKTLLKKKESQDLCFVSSKALPKYLEKKIGKDPGNFIDEEGNILGRHKGRHFYTVGQRKRLNLGSRYYVKDYNIKKNEILVTKDPKDIGSKELFVKPVYFISGEFPKKKIKIKAKVRYSQPLAKAILYPAKNGKMKVVFNKIQDYVVAGQFCVFYRKKVCIGAGIIN